MALQLNRREFLFASAAVAAQPEKYVPPSDDEGGWRTRDDAAGIDRKALDRTFNYIQGSSKNGGLLVLHHGWLVYERYFGKGHREAAPNLASCGKSVTSIAVGILLGRRPDLFPAGLDQLVYNERYLPPKAFPLSDPRKSGIRLGQLLAMTAGIRGNNPGFVRGKQVRLDPEGPDGWEAVVDEMALGMKAGPRNAIKLWCAPGEGYSYATSSIHIASIVLRHLTGVELQEFVREHIAAPLGWRRWGWGYRRPEIRHTPGGGGTALRGTDVLRFGYLLLRDGRWGAREVVPREYVRHCRGPSRFNPHYPYSLQFDVNAEGTIPGVPPDAFWKQGSGAHCFYVVPSLDLVVFKLGGRDSQYDPDNTGLPAAPASSDTDPAWKPVVEPEQAAHETLRMVVTALQKPGTDGTFPGF